MCGTLITGEEDKYNTEDKTFTGKNAYTGLIGTQSDLRVIDFNLQDVGSYWCQIEDGDIQLASSRIGHFINNSNAACGTSSQFQESALCADLPSPTAVSCVSSTYYTTPTCLQSSCVPTPTAPYTASLHAHMSLTTTLNASFTSTGGAVPSITAFPGPPQQHSFWLFVYIGAGCCLLVWTVFLFCVVCCCAFHRKRNRSHVQKKQHHNDYEEMK